MTLNPQPEAEADHLEALQAAWTRSRESWQAEGGLSIRARKDFLKRLVGEVRSRRDAIVEAIDADFGGRSRHETLLAEVWQVVEATRHTRKHLEDWAKPEPREVSLHFQPATARVVSQPLGVVGIIAPWNYPFYLALLPLVAAIGAGNRVLVKPSEYTPRTAQLLVELLGAVFPPEVVAVVEGGPRTGAAFAGLPFDHLLFTGSTAVGRKVMAAAAPNLTPVTLELGGKSPAILHESFPVARFAERVAAGKLLNAGQTCIAPDYALVPQARLEAFVTAYQEAVAQFLPSLGDNGDYTAIINERHLRRIQALVDDARERGATVHEINPRGEELEGTGKLVPSLITGVTEEMAVMQEEIFGPVLPVLPVDSLDEAIAYVNAHPRPLALYYFDRSRRRGEEVVERTHSGGVCINDVMLHITQESLPFGGVGPSGMGAYHGLDGFRTFSHEKSVFVQSRVNAVRLLSPPYGALADRLLKLFIGA